MLPTASIRPQIAVQGDSACSSGALAQPVEATLPVEDHVDGTDHQAAQGPLGVSPLCRVASTSARTSLTFR